MEKDLNSILDEFDPSEHADSRDSRACITVWIPEDLKARYDRLQTMTRRGFGRKLKELIIAAIDISDKRAS